MDNDELWDLWREYRPGRFSLQDRGYIAGVHPLELWLVAYLQDHPNAPGNEVSKRARMCGRTYTAGFSTGNMHKHNTRIRVLLEEDAFDRILQDWRGQEYPFGHLVPSYGSCHRQLG